MSCITSGNISASALIASGRNKLRGILVNTDGTNAATIIVYDNTAASGKILMEVSVPGASLYGGYSLDIPVRAEIGLYAAVSGTGARGNIYFGS